MPTRAIRGRVLSFLAGEDETAHRLIEDGLVVVEDGRIASVGDAAGLLASLSPNVPVDDHRPHLVLPGLIDVHIHYPQTRVIASYGARLLEWLQTYTFVEEQRFADPDHAAAVASFFLDELLRNGTTTAAVYCTTHPQSVEAFLAEAERRGMRMIAGKVMMDRGAPEPLLDDPQRSYDDSKSLLARWHGRGRLGYAVTPRFAVTSSDAQLEAAGALLREHPDVWLQTHLSENHEEIASVLELFPRSRSYTDVYDRFGLLGPKSIFGHCIHLDDDELDRLSSTSSVAAFCPTSNLFIGSGLFNLARLRDPARPVRVGLATDIGGGTSYSMLRTAAAAYEVLQLRQQNLPALAAFRLLTLGNAEALGLADRIGRIEPGLEADLVVLDSRATPAIAHRMESVDGDLAEELFVLMTLGDDRAVRTTYVQGRPVPRGEAVG